MFQSLKYGRSHCWECTCVDCINDYLTHNRNKNCTCPDCAQHRVKALPRIRPKKTVTERTTTVATVNFCEREQCQTMGKSHVMGLVTYSTEMHSDNKAIELCPGCVGEFMEWLDKAPETERPKAYKEPWVKTEKSAETMTSSQLFALALEASKREMED
jgi:hypothetical protein